MNRQPKGFTQRVVEGGYYTDGVDVYEVTDVHALGSVGLRNIATEQKRDVGIAALRRSYWLVAGGVLPGTAGAPLNAGEVNQ